MTQFVAHHPIAGNISAASSVPIYDDRSGPSECSMMRLVPNTQSSRADVLFGSVSFHPALFWAMTVDF
ncbi:MAG: hypothetical protein JKY96_03870 [Phycisphaerales bacterium]|nr:hypothetical protein [Phycisphaerales bacterium]